VLGTYEDITELKREHVERRKLETQVQNAQKLESLGVLAGGIAHDFNNLLMAILGNTDLALADLSPVSPIRQYLHEVEKASRRAADLCRQMLAYSGKGRFVIQALDLGEVIQEMAHMLEVSISKKAILKYNFAANLPAIEADVSQIRQIIMNLVINASEAIGDKSGVISISTGAMECDRAYLTTTWLNENLAEGLYVYIEVADTGCGIHKDLQPKIFDPFYSTKFIGRGLGLAAVLGIVRGHKGAIKVYSEEGRGSTFKVLFPAASYAADQAPDEKTESSPLQSKGAVLLVDDEESVRVIGKQMLIRLGFKVLTAMDGRDAVNIFQERSGSAVAPEERIICVILDLTMPHMDGEEAFRELRRIQPDVCVVLSSGYNEQEVTQRFVGKGLAGFIQKPYRMAMLAEKMKQVMKPKGTE
ncbi:MAG: response regulator, partial [Candidatus Sumerlaeota bacterium]|nr:response regulator [Candidatus Sumerlaeota bacterium]